MKKIYNMKISTIIMILLPILSILIGYFGVKLYLLSNNNFNDEIDANRPGVEEIHENNDLEHENSDIESEESSTDVDDSSTNTEDSSANQNGNELSNSEKKVTNRIDGINYYSIQVGSFSNEENATEFRNDLIDQGYFSYFISNDNYKVFVAASHSKEMLEEELKVVKESISDAFIKSISLESKNFSYSVDENDYFKEMSELIRNQINSIDLTLSTNSIKEELVEIKKINEKFIEASSINKSVGNQIEKYISDVENEITTLETENKESIKAFLEKNIGLFIKYFQ